jgi:hypothetical protein
LGQNTEAMAKTNPQFGPKYATKKLQYERELQTGAEHMIKQQLQYIAN